MGDRLKELSPVLLVGAILLGFYLTRAEGPALSWLPFVAVAPTPTAVPPAVSAPANRPPSTAASLTIALCNPSQPRFVSGAAQLKGALGSIMGEPVDCESAVDADGNTQQNTTTGLAYYRKHLNITCFTTGWDHWALRPDKSVVHWAGESVDPPPDASLLRGR